MEKHAFFFALACLGIYISQAHRRDDEGEDSGTEAAGEDSAAHTAIAIGLQTEAGLPRGVTLAATDIDGCEESVIDDPSQGCCASRKSMHGTFTKCMEECRNTVDYGTQKQTCLFIKMSQTYIDNGRFNCEFYTSCTPSTHSSKYKSDLYQLQRDDADTPSQLLDPNEAASFRLAFPVPATPKIEKKSSEATSLEPAPTKRKVSWVGDIFPQQKEEPAQTKPKAKTKPGNWVDDFERRKQGERAITKEKTKREPLYNRFFNSGKQEKLATTKEQTKREPFSTVEAKPIAD